MAVCPFGAIAMEADKAVVTEACTACGACIDACPAGTIVRAEETRQVSMDKAEYKDVWVFVEVSEGKARGVGLELLGEGRKLADGMGQKLCGVLIGHGVEGLAQEVFACGADKVYLVEGPEYGHYSTDAFTAAFADLIGEYKPAVILIGATNDGRDLGPRVACRVGTGLTADCTGLGIDGETGLVAWTRPAFGGNIMATILCPDHRPQMGTVRPKVFKKPAADYGRTGEIVRVASKVRAEDIRTRLVEVDRKSVV